MSLEVVIIPMLQYVVLSSILGYKTPNCQLSRGFSQASSNISSIDHVVTVHGTLQYDTSPDNPIIWTVRDQSNVDSSSPDSRKAYGNSPVNIILFDGL